MKNNIKLFAIFFALFLTSCTNQEGLKPIQPVQNVDKQTYKSVGVIKKIDLEKSKLTVDHEDIPGYMSAMEMDEAVKDKKLLENLKIGDKVDFEIERTGSDVVFTKVTKIGEVADLSGAEIYKTNCSECHGVNGEGAKKGIPLVSGHALHHSEVEHIKQVTDGETDKMPAFKNKLSTTKIAEVVKFVRTEIQKGAVREDSHLHLH